MARKLVDDGQVGTITSGTAHVMSHGMEHWHPNPDFFFRPGGGPILDLGPYYIANLINLIGPIRRVAALTSMATATRTISSEPRKGETIKVTTPTTIQALLEFESGASITLVGKLGRLGSSSSQYGALWHGRFDVSCRIRISLAAKLNWQSRARRPSLSRPGRILSARPTRNISAGMMANYRTAGLADMAVAILQGRDIRCSLERALHGVDVMVSILRSGEEKKFIDIKTSCTRPEALGIKEAKSLLKKN